MIKETIFHVAFSLKTYFLRRKCRSRTVEENEWFLFLTLPAAVLNHDLKQKGSALWLPPPGVLAWEISRRRLQERGPQESTVGWVLRRGYRG
jgi:hypothetical protein